MRFAVQGDSAFLTHLQSEVVEASKARTSALKRLSPMRRLTDIETERRLRAQVEFERNQLRDAFAQAPAAMALLPEINAWRKLGMEGQKGSQ
jgi:hypothetical protein